MPLRERMTYFQQRQYTHISPQQQQQQQEQPGASPARESHPRIASPSRTSAATHPHAGHGPASAAAPQSAHHSCIQAPGSSMQPSSQLQQQHNAPSTSAARPLQGEQRGAVPRLPGMPGSIQQGPQAVEVAARQPLVTIDLSADTQGVHTHRCSPAQASPAKQPADTMTDGLQQVQPHHMRIRKG